MFKMSKNAFVLFSSDIIGRVLGMLATIYIARVLKADNYGIITIGFSFLFYAVWFSDLGLGLFGTREFARINRKRPVSLGDILFLKIILSVVVFGGMLPVIYLFYSDPSYHNTINLFLLSVFADAVLLEWYFKGKRKYVPILINRTVFGVVYLILIFFFMTRVQHISRVPLFYLFSNLTGALVIFLFKDRQDTIFPIRFHPAKYLDIIKSSFKMGLGGLFAQIIRLLPPIVLGIFYTSYEAGIFGAALKIVTLSLLLDRIFISLYLPKMTHSISISKKDLELPLTLLLKFIILIGFSVSVTISICSEGFIHLIFGSDYLPGSAILAVLSWFLAATLINSVFSIYLIAIGKEGDYLKASMKGAVVTIILISVLSYYYSAVGAAVGVVISEIGFILFMFTQFRKYISVNALYALFISVALSVGFYAFFVYFEMITVWFSPLIWLLFILVSLLFRVITKKEILTIVSYEKDQAAN